MRSLHVGKLAHISSPTADRLFTSARRTAASVTFVGSSLRGVPARLSSVVLADVSRFRNIATGYVEFLRSYDMLLLVLCTSVSAYMYIKDTAVVRGRLANIRYTTPRTCTKCRNTT